MAKSKHTLESVIRAADRHKNMQVKRDLIYDGKGKSTGEYSDPYIVIMGHIGQKMLGKLDYLSKCHPKVKVVNATKEASTDEA
jgi:hypothetical protein